MPIVLAETLKGLDAYYQGSSTFFRRSPRLLYMWLLERFHSVGFNSVRLDNPIHFFRYPIFSALTMTSAAWTCGFRRIFMKSNGTFRGGHLGPWL